MELERARRGGQSLSIVIGDLDHFKARQRRARPPRRRRRARPPGAHPSSRRRARRRLGRAHGRRGVHAAAARHDRARGVPRRRAHARTASSGSSPTTRCRSRSASASPPSPTTGRTRRRRDRGRRPGPLRRQGARAQPLDHLQPRDLGDLRPGRPAAVALDATHIWPRCSRSPRRSTCATRAPPTTRARSARYCAPDRRPSSGCAPERVKRVEVAGVLHDIGKIGVPDAMLQKPGALGRSRAGRDPHASGDRRAGAGGRGPRGPAPAGCSPTTSVPTARATRPASTDAEIPLEAKILAVADAYEAMTADRVYRPGMGTKAARAELLRCAGTQFDARVVAAFMAVLDRSSAEPERRGAQRERAYCGA